ncbi:N-acetylmuramic acid 6-phosphate etherase [Sanguibacter inulinus]|uniref:N-acetylmuramic acid 6-phosphate etherase n=1 Tax=Sanguibacter inulinus TaxID=60922 RepID=A0A853ENW3_9MICO|nr:N-acetylmuramic acid 6-phosphate etherase [Sanguibacter inulinus]MBF0721086.1 N-acetylmuramic acid 6-phosphate etherase [Sanguibacter inulinus]NYS92231.1 N-acetylmuramic acid 6-phosphate etherase [Sanguibacter inulinus]
MDTTGATGAGAEIDLSTLTTESLDPRYSDLDTLDVAALTAAMNDAEAEVPVAVRAALPQITEAIEQIVDRVRAGGRILYVGAGTPGRLGVLDASECPPTFSTDPETVQGIIAGGPAALRDAVEGAEDDTAAGAALVDEHLVTAADAVVGLTASGRTPYVLAAIEAARSVGALTVGVSCNAGAELSTVAELAIEVVVGPEIVSGSTRLKAGSAQKQVLNMISTVSMVRLGKTYGNLMVDVAATNAKLRVRARRLVEQIAAVDPQTADSALAASGGHVKVAAAMLVHGVDRPTAERWLADADGRLRTVIEGR